MKAIDSGAKKIKRVNPMTTAIGIYITLWGQLIMGNLGNNLMAPRKRKKLRGVLVAKDWMINKFRFRDFSLSLLIDKSEKPCSLRSRSSLFPKNVP